MHFLCSSWHAPLSNSALELALHESFQRPGTLLLVIMVAGMIAEKEVVRSVPSHYMRNKNQLLGNVWRLESVAARSTQVFGAAMASSVNSSSQWLDWNVGSSPD